MQTKTAGIMFAIALGSLAAPGSRAQPTAAATAVVRADQPGPVVNKNIYGHFAEHLGRGIYEGLWVGPGSPIPNTRGIRNDVVAALRELNIPVLRWPGGCFADEYHWKDGIGPRDKRPSMINTHWGGVVEDNSFGTHEFMDLVEQLGTDAYITGNVGSGTPQEMMEWVEYLTSDAISPTRPSGPPRASASARSSRSIATGSATTRGRATKGAGGPPRPGASHRACARPSAPRRAWTHGRACVPRALRVR